MEQVFGFSSFKSDHQKEAINAIITEQRKDFVINMATQSGKSLCYQLPGDYFHSHSFEM